MSRIAMAPGQDQETSLIGRLGLGAQSFESDRGIADLYGSGRLACGTAALNSVATMGSLTLSIARPCTFAAWIAAAPTSSSSDEPLIGSTQSPPRSLQGIPILMTPSFRNSVAADPESSFMASSRIRIVLGSRILRQKRLTCSALPSRSSYAGRIWQNDAVRN